MSNFLTKIILCLLVGTQAFAGPRSGGGSDFAQDRKATIEEIKEALQSARLALPFLLKGIEESIQNRYFYQRNKTLFPVFNQIINADNLPNVFEHFQQMRFELKDVCRDQFHVPKGASAYPYNSMSICFDLKWIRKNSTRADLYPRMLALTAHEFAHKRLVIDESLVRLFEQAVRAVVPTMPLIQIEENLQHSIQLSENLLKATSPEQLQVNACNSVGQIHQLAESLSLLIQMGRVDFEKIGLRLLDFPLMQAKEELRIRAELSNGYCRQNSEEPELINSINRYLVPNLQESLTPPTVGDMAGLKNELSRVRELTQQILRSLQKDFQTVQEQAIRDQSAQDF